jgi:O-antigen/teichoic acid export membrane protein
VMSRIGPIADRCRSVILGSANTSQSRVVSGSLVLLGGSGLVSLINLAYNVGIARLLGPVAFGEVAAVYTLLMLISAITLSFQLVCAKFVAQNETPGGKAAVYRALLIRSWQFGAAIALLLVLFSKPISGYLNINSPWLVIFLAVGITFYVPLGVRRGGMQGLYAFRRLAVNFLIEGAVKLVGAFVLIHLGFGVQGAMGAVSASLMLAYFFGNPGAELEVASEPALPASFREGIQAIVFFVGQVVINNVDILLIKHFFAAREAGLYAAAALVGRLVYMSSWSVVSAMFPIAAGTKPDKQNIRSVLIPPLLIVFLITGCFTLGLWLFPNIVWRVIFGANFYRQELSSYSSLFVLYAAATGIYSLCVVLITYEMSHKIANTGWVQLAFSGAIVLGIALFHATLQQAVIVQLVLLTMLLIAASAPFFRRRQTSNGAPLTPEFPPVPNCEG